MEGNGRRYRRKFLTPCIDEDVDCIETILSSIMTEMMHLALDNILNERPAKICVEVGEEPNKSRFEVEFDKRWRLVVPEQNLEWVMAILEELRGKRTISPQARVDRRKTLGII